MGDLNLPCAYCNGNAGCISVAQASINSLVWENGFTQLADSPTRGDVLLDVYLSRHESSFKSSSVVEGISCHYWVILEVEWEGNYCVPQVERLLPVYHKTDLSDLNPSCGKILQHGQEVVVTWRKYAEILRE